MLLLYQPGDAKNDTAGLFFLLAAAAILVNGEAQARAATQAARPVAGGAPEADAAVAEPPSRGFVATGAGLTPIFPSGALIVAGLAAGLALGTKLNLLAPFGLLTLGVIAVARPGDRVRTAGIWVACSLITGGFWFARNLVEAGNPLPWIDKGPLPGPDQLDIDIREPHTVSDYLTDLDVITDSFIPGLNDSFGVLWPLVLAAVIGGFVLGDLPRPHPDDPHARRRRPAQRHRLPVHAADGGRARRVSRAPSRSTCATPRPPSRWAPCCWRSTRGLSRERIQPLLLGGLALLFVGRPRQRRRRRLGPATTSLGAIVLALFLIAVPVVPGARSRWGIRPAHDRHRRRRWRIGLAVGIGWTQNDDYLDDRYQAATAPADFPEGIRIGARAGSTRRSPATRASPSSAAAPASSSTSSTATTSPTTSSTSPTRAPTARSRRSRPTPPTAQTSPPARSGGPRSTTATTTT